MVSRKSLGLVCAALVSLSAVLPCSGALLATFSLKHFKRPGSLCTYSEDLTELEISQLNRHDVVLIIDKSHSMAKKDCLRVPLDPQEDPSMSEDHLTSPISRWDWCHEQTLDLSRKIQAFMPAGVSLILFSSESVVFNNINAKAIETIFTDYTPNGKTNMAGALKSRLDLYFEQRDSIGQDTKPLLIAVITDGCPDNPSNLRYAIVDATRRMKTPGEILITFLQIGNDPKGSKLLEEFNNGGLVDRKSQFDIVNVVPFTEIRKIGLARALVDEIAKR